MKKVLRVFFLFLIIIFIFSFLFFLYKYKINIYCKSDYFSCSDEVNKIISEKNKNVFSVYLIFKKIKSLDNVENVNLKFSKNGITFLVKEKKSLIAFLKNNNYELVNIDGNINLIKNASALPVIFDNSNRLLTKEERKYIMDLSLYLIKNYDVSLIELDDLKLTVVIKNNMTAYFLKDGNLKRDLGAFIFTYSWLNKNNSQARIEEKSENIIIDFRTRNPILLNY